MKREKILNENKQYILRLFTAKYVTLHDGFG